VPRGKKPTISLPVRKRQRIEGRLDETAASAPTHTGEAGAEWSAPQRSRSKSAGNRTPNFQQQTAPSKTVGAASQATGRSPLSTQRPSTNFVKADPAAKFSLMQDLVKSWDLATPGTSNPPKATKEEVAMAEVFAQGMRAAAKCRSGIGKS